MTLIDGDDAKAVKEIWDIWFREQIPLPFGYGETSRQSSTLNERSRYVHIANIRNLLRHSREKHRTPHNLDLFSLNLPDYSRPQKTARPRPLTYSDFKLLISPDNITLFEAADREDVGHADIWLAQAFQGGRISETIRLRLGCVGLVGHAQPYIWRDISKVNVVDYGMPCYLPVYDRLLRRQRKRARNCGNATPRSSLASTHLDRQRLKRSGIAICPLSGRRSEPRFGARSLTIAVPRRVD